MRLRATAWAANITNETMSIIKDRVRKHENLKVRQNEIIRAGLDLFCQLPYDQQVELLQATKALEERET